MNRLSLFFDISGQVTRQSLHDEFFTVGGVIIPTANESSIRNLCQGNIPKWKNATPESLSFMEKTISENDVYCAVVRIEKTNQEWEAFWVNGVKQHNYLANQFKTKVGFKPGTVIRLLTFSRCAMIGLGFYLKSQGSPRILDSSGFPILNLRITYDTDIQGEQDRKAFKETWKSWFKKSTREQTLGIRPCLETVEFMTESEEPLINLPDFIAGCIHYLSSGSYLLSEQLNRSDIKQFGEFIRASEKFKFESWQFKENFPNLT